MNDRNDLDAALDAVIAAGGRLVEREHAAGVGFAYGEDVDGYVIEL